MRSDLEADFLQLGEGKVQKGLAVVCKYLKGGHREARTTPQRGTQ